MTTEFAANSDMEHLPRFTDLAYALPKFRYEGEIEPYDEKGFWTYPERRGWSLEGVLPDRYTPENSISDLEEYAQLLQSWWYFGVIHEALGDMYQLQLFPFVPQLKLCHWSKTCLPILSTPT